MLRSTFALILIIFGTMARSQEINYEQKAFDHFFAEVYKTKFADASKIQFSGHTQKELTRFELGNVCFAGEKDLRKLLYDSAVGISKSEKEINVTRVKGVNFKTRQVHSKLTLYENQANRVGDHVYVLISLYRIHSDIYYYYFDMGVDGHIIRWCESGAIQ